MPSSSPTVLLQARKPQLARWRRGLRLVASVVDPRAWLHVFKLVNYYNYSHVEPLRHIVRGPECAISPNAVFSNPRNIVLGKGVRIGADCRLWAGHGLGRIIVGDDVLFGPDVLVTAASYRYNDGQPVTRQMMDEADVVIGDDVWFGTRVVVLPGVRIGDGAIVAAGAIVKDHVPPMAIVAGQPARVVGTRKLPGTVAPIRAAQP